MIGKLARPLAGILLLAGPLLAQESKPAGKPAEDPLVGRMREAGEAYEQAFNKKDFKALGNQWTAQAELNESGKTLRGRDSIVQFVRATFVRAPQAQMDVQVEQVRPLGESATRVSGKIRVRENPEGKWFTSRFTSLRVKEGETWRIASSSVEPIFEASLDDLGWLQGKWQAEVTDGEDQGLVVTGRIQSMLGGKLLVCHLVRKPKEGAAVESIQILNPDPHTGLIRTWVFESTGGRAEGVLESDGHTLNSVLVGKPSSPEVGSRVESVQVINPVSRDEFIWQPIERVVDGARMPDQKPLRFKREK